MRRRPGWGVKWFVRRVSCPGSSKEHSRFFGMPTASSAGWRQRRESGPAAEPRLRGPHDRSAGRFRGPSFTGRAGDRDDYFIKLIRLAVRLRDIAGPLIARINARKVLLEIARK